MSWLKRSEEMQCSVVKARIIPSADKLREAKSLARKNRNDLTMAMSSPFVNNIDPKFYSKGPQTFIKEVKGRLETTDASIEIAWLRSVIAVSPRAAGGK